MEVPPIITQVIVPPEQRTAAIALLWAVIGAAVLVAVWPRGAGRRLVRQILAVAALAFREGARMKMLWTVALIAFVPCVLAYFSDGDGTHAGRARLILNVCVGCGEILGAIMVVMLAALSVSREIESRIMHTLGTKPVPRFGILVGKALGFWAIDAIFLIGLVVFGGLLVRMVPLRAETRPKDEIIVSGTWADLYRNALVTRRMQDAATGPARHKFIKPGQSLEQRFQINPAEMIEPVALRFLLSSTDTFDPVIKGVSIRAGYEGEQPLIERTLAVPQDRPFELFLAPEDLGKAGTFIVTVGAGNASPQSPSVITSVPGGVQLGIVADSFAVNMAKALALMLLQGWILALIMTGWSGVLSFPVAVAAGLILVLGGELSREAVALIQQPAAIAEERAEREGAGKESELSAEVTQAVASMLSLLPDFRTSGGPGAFVEGTLVSTWAIAHAIFWMGVVRAIGWALPGLIFFQRREVGR
ncbi:MAG TPA: ABC transporter permease subunit [Planctomycetota bacterium]|nr:ABC transporter permease subunit [Planctomycetota bacterium]